MKDHLTSALAQLNGSADWNRRTGGTLPAKLTCFEAQDVLTALQELQQRAEQAEREVERLTARESNQSERIRYLEGATNHATGTPLTHMKARAERAQAELAAERARLRQLALDACRAAAIVPVVWYPTGYYVNPNDLGKINKQQVDACVAAIDAAMKEENK